jgi:hypothetical protein
MAISIWGVGGGALILTAVLAYLQNSIVIFTAGSMGAIFYIVFLRRSWPKGYEKQAKRVYSEGSNKLMWGAHELELEEDKLIETSEGGRHELNCSAVERVVTTDQHTFIYFGSVMAHVIPRSKIIDGDLDQFVAAVKSKCGIAHT